MDFSTKTLAKGCFGKVYKQKYGDAWAAVKKVPINFITKEQLSRECHVYEKAQHINVVRLLGNPWLEDGKWHIPLEFVFGEDLETAIFTVQKSKIQLIPSVKSTIITGMCEGLNFLHSKDIVHQDLKPDNIMIEHGSYRAVIIDMGLAKFFKNGLSSAENLGNEAYAAPEIFQNNVRDKRSDVWAMGKIVAELCARVRLPTRGVTPVKIKDTLKDNPYCGVVCKMVAENPVERSSMFGLIGEIRQIGVRQGANHGVNQGMNQRMIQGINYGANQGMNHGANQWGNYGVNQGMNHGVNQGAGAGRPQAGLGGQVCPKVIGGADLGAKQKWRPPTPFPPEAKHQELPVERFHRCPSPRPQPAVPGALVPELPQPTIPCPLLHDGTVVHRRINFDAGQMEVKQIVTRNGKVVKYEDLKVFK
ncbi:Spindle assembly checkpoint kinase [Bagarius yarrelli]|uniref:Spindle assembly checkpoint kinase n=1 Tax=Bagarius yarrelli TaxID=175774 RepID=A0A556TLT1_BAGYA|nr:Spindle assembly checkpoint kinase [Bagarius yarrelli]